MNNIISQASFCNYDLPAAHLPPTDASVSNGRRRYLDQQDTSIIFVEDVMLPVQWGGYDEEVDTEEAHWQDAGTGELSDLMMVEAISQSVDLWSPTVLKNLDSVDGGSSGQLRLSPDTQVPEFVNSSMQGLGPTSRPCVVSGEIISTDLKTSTVPSEQFQPPAGSDVGDVNNAVAENDSWQYSPVGGSMPHGRSGSANTIKDSGHGLLPMAHKTVVMDTLTQQLTASADTSPPVPQLNASGSSSTPLKSSSSSRHYRTRKSGELYAVTSARDVKRNLYHDSHVFIPEANSHVHNPVSNHMWGEPSGNSDLQGLSGPTMLPSTPAPRSGQEATRGNVNKKLLHRPAYQVLVEWRYLVEMVSAGEDLNVLCAGQEWIKTPGCFQAITAKIEGWYNICPKCAELCIGPEGDWLRHLRGPHKMTNISSENQLDPASKEMFRTYRKLDLLARTNQ